MHCSSAHRPLDDMYVCMYVSAYTIWEQCMRTHCMCFMEASLLGLDLDGHTLFKQDREQAARW